VLTIDSQQPLKLKVYQHASGRLKENNEPIIDKKNITRETKINMEHK
jgi:hypothetical protein